MKNRFQILSILLFFLLSFSNVFSQQTLINVNGWNAYVHLPSDYNSNSNNYPTIIFIPGTGEVGSDASRVIANGPGAYVSQGWDGSALGVKFIIISLQPPSVWPGTSEVKSRVDALKGKYRIGDLYMTGLSMGGWVSMNYATTYPNELKKIVSVEGADIGYKMDLSQLWKGFALAGGKMINFEQLNDYRVGDKAVAAMNQWSNGSAQYLVTNYGGGGHCCWSSFYGGGGTQPGVYNLMGQSQNLYEWIARDYVGGGGQTNLSPSANAGSNITITLPQNSVTLSGSGNDPDGSITTYEWTKISGPSSYNFTSATSATTDVNNLIAGVYQFQLKVTDDKGATATATVNVTVNAAANQAPTANAGSNITITLPQSSVTLSGSGNDPDGSIASYEWTKVSGPTSYNFTSATSATTDVNNLVAGVYQFQLKVTDDKGATATATVNVTVNAAANQAPTANAGSNITITLPQSSVTLSGSGNDPDGSIATYEWTKISGPSSYYFTSATSATTDVNNLIAGVYQFQLKVTDDKGATATATVNVTVNAAPIAPVANAGADATIQLPTNTVSLNGSGNSQGGTPISQYAWSQISGPATASFDNSNSATALVTDLKAGQYVFQLTVTNQAGLSATSNVSITVKPSGDPNDCGCDVVLPKHPSGGIYFINGVTNGITIKPGDKVCIKADTYSNIYLRGIIGTPEKPITIINCGGLVRVGDSPSWNISIANCRYFRLTGTGDPNIKYGIKVNWPGGWSSTGIGVGDSCTDYEIDHYEAQNVSNGFICKINPTDCEPGTWGQNWTVRNISLHDNYIHNTVGEAFYIMNHAATVDVKDCSTGNTITVEPVAAIGVKIYNNIVDSAGWDGIQLVKAIDAEIYNNRVTNFGLGNVAGQYYGIILGGKSTGKVYNNFIANGTGPGLALTGFNENSAYNNVIANVGDIGITVDDRPMPNNEYINFRVNLFNNTVVNAGYGIRLLNGFGTMAAGSRIYNNLVVAPRNPEEKYINPYIVLNDIKLVDTANNLYFKTIDQAKFVNPGALDFTLLTNSPAINTGVDLSSYGVISDIDGLSRPQGTAYDVGAYEYNENTPPPNQKPVANAGTDQTIKLPNNKVTVNGSGTDRDGSIASYQWNKVSGPAGYNIVSATTASTEINSLQQGVYIFELTVTDDKGDIGKDSVTITVSPANVPPSANAGSDKVITLPTNSVSLSGSGIDSDGSIASYKWEKISGPSQFAIASPNSATTSVNNLVQGVYLFTFTVTDNEGALNRDTVQVTVNEAPNKAPVANAGPDRIITLPVSTASLAGSGTDEDGTIVSFQWTKISGPSNFNIVSPATAATDVSGLVTGVYEFQLTVTDNKGATATDIVRVTVNPAGNKPPVANAGTDITITLPSSTASLSGTGTDEDGNVASYQWTKISGPASYNIVNAASPSTDVSGLTEGVYEFQLEVKDDKGAIATDVVKVTVNAAPNKAPTANAGPDRIITLPTNTTSLSGSGTDPDGKIVSYQWTKTSGPNSYSIVNSASPVTDVSSLLEGVYEFQLTVTDDKGATATDMMKVTVNPVANQPPLANAGADITITLPVNSVKLSGSGSDPDGKVVSYQWIKQSGPSSFNIVNAASPVTDVSGLTEGVYEFQLKVTDDKGAIASDVVKVTVLKPANKPPVANAGQDVSIALPLNTVTLNGSGSDADGNVVKYLWTQVSGPSAATIVSAENASTEINSFIPGTYLFQLIVTDNEGAIGRDTMQLTVNAQRESQLSIINVYPNPTPDVATLEISGVKTNGRIEMVVSDVNGRTLDRKVIKADAGITIKEEINFVRYSKGVYFVTLRVNGKVLNTKKVVKLR